MISKMKGLDYRKKNGEKNNNLYLWSGLSIRYYQDVYDS